MRKIIMLILIITGLQLQASNGRYRLTLRGNPSTSVVIGWDQLSGNNPMVYYGTTDHGTDFSSYPTSKLPDRTVSHKGMDNTFARLTGLRPDTAYYFVIRDSQGTSERFWFKTAPADKSRLSLIAGGDSRNNRTPRQNANRLVAKLKPHAVLFGGDMTDDDTNSQWRTWFDDWQLTIASDGRIFPIVAARGNHEDSNNSIYNLFDTPSSSVYYAITFGDDLIRSYTLNTETSISGNQTDWLEDDLRDSSDVIWKMAQYHKPMRPHVSSKSEGNTEYNNWADLFYENRVKLVVESDSHSVKTTWPVRPSNGSGSDEGFIRDNENGTIYVGEGCWGAPLRSNNDDKDWTRDSGRFNQFKWIFVDENKIEIRTVRVDNASQVGSVSNNNPFQTPSNLDIWNPSNGRVVTINNGNVIPNPDPDPDPDTGDGSIDVAISNANDDAEESESGEIYLDSSDLELVYDSFDDSGNQVVGLRFRSLALPQNAAITSAYIQFNADESNSANAELEIALHNSSNSPVFTSSDNNISNRSVFSNKVIWDPNSWSSGQNGTAQRTPDLKSMVQQLVNDNDWSPGNSASFIIRGVGVSLTNTSAKRVADSYEGGSGNAARLIVNYNVNTDPDPDNGNYTSIPSLVQAEDFNTQSGVRTENTSDNGGGQNVGFIDSGDFLTYTINVPSSGDYTINFRIASRSNGTSFDIFSGNSIIGNISSDATGGWQVWETVSETISLNRGDQTIRLVATGNGWNINWLDFSEGDNNGGPGPNPVSDSIEVAISNGDDDAEESEDGDMYLDSSDLELVYDSFDNSGNQAVGLRFRSLALPPNATITNAYIQFNADESNSANAELEISLHNSSNSPVFTSNDNNISDRSVFSNRVIWDPNSWSSGQNGTAQRTPDLKNMVQQLVNKNGWSSGNNASFIIRGTGVSLTNTSAKRVADSYEGGSGNAARLIVDYTIGEGSDAVDEPVVKDICFDMIPWQSNTNYAAGNQVIYLDFLYERTSSGWENLGACGILGNDDIALSREKSPTPPPINDNFAFDIYPNPFTDKLTITTSAGLNEKFKMTIYDLHGKVVYDGFLDSAYSNETTIDVGGITQSGFYLLSIQDLNGRIMKTEKIVK